MCVQKTTILVYGLIASLLERIILHLLFSTVSQITMNRLKPLPKKLLIRLYKVYVYLIYDYSSILYHSTVLFRKLNKSHLHVFTITGVVMGNAGLYTCRADNNVGMRELTFTVTVNGKWVWQQLIDYYRSVINDRVGKDWNKFGGHC